MDEEYLSLDIGRSSVCYFFFKDDDDNRRSGAQALCAILHQLLVQKPALLKHAMQYYKNNGAHLRNMFRELWDIIIACANDPEAGEIICVLDALDECKKSSREDLITALSRFYSTRAKTKMKLKFLVTSRPYHNIEKSFYSSIKDLSTIRLKGEYESEKISKEIDMIIDHWVPRISEARETPLELVVQNVLMEQLKKIPHRTYLWLHLILDVVRTSLDSTKRSIERLVKRLPRTVEDAYDKILTRIDDSDFAEQARRLLHIIVAAARPLTLQEMNIALAIDGNLGRGEPCQSYNDLDLEKKRPFQDKIRNLCGLFVSITDSKIYLIHQTAREFLISNDFSRNHGGSSREIWKHSLDLAESHLILLKICLSYLLLQEHNRQIDEGDEIFDEDQPDEGGELDEVDEMDVDHDFEVVDEVDNVYVFDQMDGGGEMDEEDRMDEENKMDEGDDFLVDNSLDPGKFLKYAADRWTTHFRQAIIGDHRSVLPSALDVCDPHSNRFQRWFRVHWGSKNRPLITSNLTIASLFGLGEIVELLLKMESVELNPTDQFGRTPLLWAAEKGHIEVIKLLLKMTKVELNHRDHIGQTPLSLAALNGHDEVIKLLIETNRVDPNSKDIYDQTPFSLAAEKGHVEVIKLLFKTEIIDFQSDKTSLSHAAKNGHVGVIRLLLQMNGIDLNGKDTLGRTPLSWAAYGNHIEVIKLLLETNRVDLNSQDKYGQTPLSYATKKEYFEVAQLLFNTRRVKLDSIDKSGLIKLFLKMDNVDLNTNIIGHQTALSWAVEDEDVAMIIKLLIEPKKFELYDSKYNDSTISSIAAEKGKVEIIKLLLKTNRIDIDCMNNTNQTPISRAAYEGHVDVIKLLLKTGKIELNSIDIFGKTLLDYAAENEHFEVAQLLLNMKNVELKFLKKSGNALLLSAIHNRNTAMFKSLLEINCVDLNFTDKYGKTPLSLVATNGHVKMVKLLINTKRVKFNLIDIDYGRTPFLWAVHQRHIEVVRLLINTKNVELNFKDKHNQTPFSLAITNGHVEMIKLLINTKDVEFNPIDIDSDQTPLSWAAREGHVELINILLEIGSHQLNSKNKCAQTLLSLAIEKGQVEMIELLLKTERVDINFVDEYNKTPVLYAIKNKHTEMTKLLLERGIEFNFEHNLYKTPRSWITNQRLDQIVKLLLKMYDLKFDLSEIDFRRTLLPWAIEKEHVEMIKLLIETDIGFHLKRNITQSALLWAAMNGHVDVMKLLINTQNVEIEYVNSFGRTPLLWIARNEYVEVL